MDQDEMDLDDPSTLPTQPLYAQIKARQRPSPKGEQRLWLYQCAQKPCSRGETKISGTSRPKGRDVPSCTFCNGKMHWKGTERHPGSQSGVSPTSNDSAGRPATANSGSGSGSGHSQPGGVRPMPGAPFSSQSSSSTLLSQSQTSHSSTSSRPHTSLGHNISQFQHDPRTSNSSSGSTGMAPGSMLPPDQRGGRPWEL